MLISIIIPVYNTKPTFIKEALNSATLLDGLCDYEIIVVNDGSTNPETCEFLNDSKNFNIFHGKNFQIIHKPNGGVSSTRNIGIKKAKGKFIFPLDSDDVVNSEVNHFVEYLINNPDTDILYGNLIVFGDVSYYHTHKPFYRYELWLVQNQLSACSIFSKNIWEKAQGYDETFITAEDWNFWCRCASVGAIFTYIPYVNYQYRIIQDGQSLWQKTKDTIPEYHQKTLSSLPMSLLDINELKQVFCEKEPSYDNNPEFISFVNISLRKQLHKKRRKAIGILIFAYFPRLFYWLCKKDCLAMKIISFRNYSLSYK